MVSPQDTAETAARLIIKHKVGALPVVENGAVVGIISTSDLLKAMLNVLEAAKQIIQR
jgi:acetoin utilization protein AcuB